MPRLDEIGAALEDGSLIRLPEALECDAIIAARDQDEDFSLAWRKADETVGAATNESSATRVRELERAAFLLASEQAPQHGIVLTVSKDIALLARAAANGIDSPFLRRLWSAYVLFGFAVPAVSSES
jgi:hypothetical protein